MRTVPKQNRRISTEQSMLDAAEELLDNGNALNVTVENILHLSGNTVETFQEQFGSIEGLFEALHRKHIASISESIQLQELEMGIDEPDLKSGLRHICQILLEFAYEERKLIAYFFSQPSQDSFFARQIGADSILAILQTHKSEVAHKDLRKSSINTTRLIYQMILGLAFLEPSEVFNRKVTLRNMVDSITQWAYAYLTTEQTFQKSDFHVPDFY